MFDYAPRCSSSIGAPEPRNCHEAIPSSGQQFPRLQTTGHNHAQEQKNAALWFESTHNIQNQRERKQQHGSNHPLFTQGARQRCPSAKPHQCASPDHPDCPSKNWARSWSCLAVSATSTNVTKTDPLRWLLNQARRRRGNRVPAPCDWRSNLPVIPEGAATSPYRLYGLARRRLRAIQLRPCKFPCRSGNGRRPGQNQAVWVALEFVLQNAILQ